MTALGENCVVFVLDEGAWANAEDQPTTRGRDGSRHTVSRWQAQIDTTLLAAADIAPECVAVLASSGATSRTILPPTFGGPDAWARPLLLALLHVGAPRRGRSSSSAPPLPSNPTSTVISLGAGARGGRDRDTAPLDLSRSFRHALLVLKRCGVHIPKAGGSGGGGCVARQLQMNIHDNTHDGNGGGGGDSRSTHARGVDVQRGRCRVVVMAAGPWTLDRATAPEAQLRDARVEVIGALFNDQSRDRASNQGTASTPLSPPPTTVSEDGDDGKERDEEQRRRGGHAVSSDTASPLATRGNNRDDDEGQNKNGTGTDTGGGGGGSCGLLAAFVSAVNGRGGDVLQLGRGGGGNGVGVHFDFNFRAALVGSRLVASDCPERMRQSWRACFGENAPCPDLGCVLPSDHSDDDGSISPLDDFSMLSLKYSFEQGDDDDDDNGGGGDGGEGGGGEVGECKMEVEAGRRPHEPSVDRISAGAEVCASAHVPSRCLTSAASRFGTFDSTGSFGGITVGNPPPTLTTAADRGGGGGGGGVRAGFVMGEMERAVTRRLGVQLHREACKSLGRGESGVVEGDRATTTAMMTTGDGAGAGRSASRDGGGGGVVSTSANPSPPKTARSGVGGGDDGGSGGRGSGGGGGSLGITGGCRGAMRALNERGVTLGFAEVKLLLHDSRAAAAAVAGGGSPDAGLVSVRTGLEPAQLHRVLVALVTPIVVVCVGRLVKAGALLRPTKRTGRLALHAAAGGGVRLTWLGESTVPGAAAASLGRRAEGTALAAAARNIVLPTTLATVEPAPPTPRPLPPSARRRPNETAAAAAAAHPRIEFIQTDPSGRSFRLIIPPRAIGGKSKELFFYLRGNDKELGSGGWAWGSVGAGTGAGAARAAGAAAAAASGMQDSSAALARLQAALSSPPSLATRAHLPEEALAKLSDSVTPGVAATLLPGAACAHCHALLLAGLPGCLVCPASPF